MYPLAIIIIYFLFTSIEEKTTFLAVSLLSNALKTVQMILSILYNFLQLPTHFHTHDFSQCHNRN